LYFGIRNVKSAAFLFNLNCLLLQRKNVDQNRRISGVFMRIINALLHQLHFPTRPALNRHQELRIMHVKKEEKAFKKYKLQKLSSRTKK
jgi:hypothetical protein